MASSQDNKDLDGYDLVEEIGGGQQSVVHKAVCTRGRLCSRLVAVKVTRLEHAKNDIEVSLTTSSALQQELYHPNVLGLYSTFVQLNSHIQVTEYCSSGSLAEYKENKGIPLPADSFTVRLMRGIANGLVYLHYRGIIHRAIQPTNIFLGENQIPKISHFESATRLPSICPPFISPTAYTAPEIIRGQPGSFPADIWSLGCVALFILAAQPPCALATTPMALRTLKCSPQLREVLTSVLEYSPSHRLSAEILASHQVFKLPLTNSNDANPPTAPGQLRRNSCGDLGISKAKQQFLISGGIMTGKHKWSSLTRRVVSDPIVMNKGSGYIEIPIGSKGTQTPLDSDSLPFANHGPGLAKPRPVPNSTIRQRECKEGAHQLEHIDTSCLRPQSQKTKEGCVSVLRNGHVAVDFRDCPGIDEIEGKVMVIDSRQNQVLIYKNSNFLDTLHHPIPLAQYTRESLPPSLWKQYRAASVFVGQVRKQTPKVPAKFPPSLALAEFLARPIKFVVHADDGRYTLMMNGPCADVEVAFFPIVTHRNSERQPDNDETTLRIRYSEEQGQIELRRYTGGLDGQIWKRKCVTSICNLKDIPQAEWASLDDLERDGLMRLLRFSGLCRTIEKSGLAMHNFDHRE